MVVAAAAALLFFEIVVVTAAALAFFMMVVMMMSAAAAFTFLVVMVAAAAAFLMIVVMSAAAAFAFAMMVVMTAATAAAFLFIMVMVAATAAFLVIVVMPATAALAFAMMMVVAAAAAFLFIMEMVAATAAFLVIVVMPAAAALAFAMMMVVVAAAAAFAFLMVMVVAAAALIFIMMVMMSAAATAAAAPAFRFAELNRIKGFLGFRHLETHHLKHLGEVGERKDREAFINLGKPNAAVDERARCLAEDVEVARDVEHLLNGRTNGPERTGFINEEIIDLKGAKISGSNAHRHIARRGMNGLRKLRALCGGERKRMSLVKESLCGSSLRGKKLGKRRHGNTVLKYQSSRCFAEAARTRTKKTCLLYEKERQAGLSLSE